MRSSLLLLGMLGLVSCSSFSKKNSDLNNDESIACKTFRAKIPDDWFQQLLEVPENPNAPDGVKIKIFYYGLIHPNTVPTVYYNGGPESNSHWSGNWWSENNKNIDPEQKISFVFIDQRGTGCSSPYPQTSDRPSEEEVKAVLARLQFYGADGIIADSEAIRRNLLAAGKIKSKKWNVFGQSYGGLIAYRYLVTAPESLQQVFTHGFALNKNLHEKYWFRHRSQVDVAREYLKLYPQDKLLLQKIKAALPEEYCFYNGSRTQSLCGHQAMKPFISMLGSRTEWARLNRWINALLNTNGTLKKDQWQRLLDAYVFSQSAAAETDVRSQKWPRDVINWIDFGSFSKGHSYYCHEKGKNFISLVHDFPINECLDVLQKPPASAQTEYPPLKQLKITSTQPEDLYEALKKTPDVRLHVYSSRLDIYSPRSAFVHQQQLLKNLPNATYTKFENSGHDGFLHETSFWQRLQQASILPGN